MPPDKDKEYVVTVTGLTERTFTIAVPAAEDDPEAYAKEKAYDMFMNLLVKPDSVEDVQVEEK